MAKPINKDKRPYLRDLLKKFIYFSVLALFAFSNYAIPAMSQLLAGFLAVPAINASDGHFKKIATKAKQKLGGVSAAARN